jgi:hypothetical protein
VSRPSHCKPSSSESASLDPPAEWISHRMDMKKCVCVVALPILMASCSHQPPPYESNYRPPQTTAATTAPSAPTQAPQLRASFVETFDRPDTKFGLGDGWDTRKRPVPGNPVESVVPIPATTSAEPDNPDDSDSTIYASRAFGQTVRSVGAKGGWSRTGRGRETTFTMAISANEQLTTDMVHLAANRSIWKLTVRRTDGVFEPVASGHFSPLLKLDQDYIFEILATEETLTVRVPGREVTKDVPTSGLLGPHAYWEDYPDGHPTGVAFQFDTVWAVEDGQPLVPFDP